MTIERKELLKAQISEVFDNEEILEDSPKIATVNDLCNFLSQHDVDATEEEINELVNEGSSLMEGDMGEIDLVDLENVVGGVNVKKVLKFLKKAVVYTGFCVGAVGIGFVCALCPYCTPAVAKGIAIAYGLVAVAATKKA